MKVRTPKEVRMLVETLLELEQAMPGIIGKQRIWDRPVSVQDKVGFIRSLADVRAKMFIEVEEIYPELTDNASVSIGRYFITYEEQEIIG